MNFSEIVTSQLWVVAFEGIDGNLLEMQIVDPPLDVDLTPSGGYGSAGLGLWSEGRVFVKRTSPGTDVVGKDGQMIEGEVRPGSWYIVAGKERGVVRVLTTNDYPSEVNAVVQLAAQQGIDPIFLRSDSKWK